MIILVIKESTDYFDNLIIWYFLVTQMDLRENEALIWLYLHTN